MGQNMGQARLSTFWGTAPDYRPVASSNTAIRGLTKQNKRLKPLNPVLSDPSKQCLIVHTSVRYTQANLDDVLVGAIQTNAVDL